MDRKLGRAWFLRSGYCERGCHHPHVHCVVAAGGLSCDHARWVRPRNPRFFLPEGVLGEVFRGKFLETLQQAHASGQLQFHGLLRGLAQPKLFRALIRQLYAMHWVVYCKPPFGGPDQVLRYLGAYTPPAVFVGTNGFTVWEARCEIVRRAIAYLEKR
jgi:hypothetical protein